MQDEAVAFEKIAEIEAQQKLLEKETLDIQERKKDLEQENKILELQENQAKKYQQEILENKETLRLLKLESQKEILKKEDTSAITQEIEELIRQKDIEQEEIKEIKIQKKKLLDRADETIKSAKEIKTVLGEHNDHKNKIEELKSEICINLNQFKSIKNQVDVLVAENDQLKKENEKLNSQEIPDPNKDLENKISELISQKNQVLEENLKIKNQKTLLIKTEALPNGKFALTIPCSSGGFNVYTKTSIFTEDEIKKYLEISSRIDEIDTAKTDDSRNNIFQSMLKTLINPQLSNRDYNKIKPTYKYIA
jgi:chromosome segregation ATPase